MPYDLEVNISFDSINAAAVCAFVPHSLRPYVTEVLGVQAAAFRAGHVCASMKTSALLDRAW
jgi:hypothetical protein